MTISGYREVLDEEIIVEYNITHAYTTFLFLPKHVTVDIDSVSTRSTLISILSPSVSSPPKHATFDMDLVMTWSIFWMEYDKSSCTT